VSKAYFSDPRLNASTLKAWLNESPRRATWLMANGKTTDAMRTGTLVHEQLELCGKTPNHIVVSPYDDYRKAEARTWRDDQLSIGKTPLKQNEFDKIAEMARMVWDECPNFVKEMIQDPASLRENEVYTEHHKSLEDLYHAASKTIVDYKTTAKTTEDGFIRDAYKMGYALQAAFYLNNHPEAERFIFVAVSSVEPYEVFVFEADDSFIAYGQSQVAEAYKRLQAGIPEKVCLPISAPPWAALDVEPSFEEIF
jgi:hypothetical protein